jgi:hypothetical protein
MKKSLIIIPPNWHREDYTMKEDCAVLLIPDSATEIIGYFGAECVVSYGMSEKSTITLSSISEHETVVALQREVPTIHGEILERQELKLKRAGIPEESLLAIVGVLLVTGTAPEKLCDFF